jgi:hypothetical protein
VSRRHDVDEGLPRKRHCAGGRARAYTSFAHDQGWILREKPHAIACSERPKDCFTWRLRRRCQPPSSSLARRRVQQLGPSRDAARPQGFNRPSPETECPPGTRPLFRCVTLPLMAGLRQYWALLSRRLKLSIYESSPECMHGMFLGPSLFTL